MKLLTTDDKIFLFVKTGDGRLVLTEVTPNRKEGSEKIFNFTFTEKFNQRNQVEVIGYINLNCGNKHYFFGIQQCKTDTIYNIYEVNLDEGTICVTGPSGRENERRIKIYDKVECYFERSSCSIHVALLDSEKKQVDYIRLSQIQMNWELEPQSPIFSGNMQDKEELTNMCLCFT